MSKDVDEIRRKIHEKHAIPDSVFPAVVKEVNETDFTCTVRQDDVVNYFDVRLRSLVNTDKGVAMIPTIDSIVLVCRIARSNELFVCQFSQVDKIIITSNESSILLDNTGFKLSVGESIIKTSENGITIAKADTGLKKTLNDILDAIQQLTVTTGVGPSGMPINATAFKKIQNELSNYLE